MGALRGGVVGGVWTLVREAQTVTAARIRRSGGALRTAAFRKQRGCVTCLETKVLCDVPTCERQRVYFERVRVQIVGSGQIAQRG